MGGTASGLAASSHARQPGGGDLFDYWFSIEGVSDVVEMYKAARLVNHPTVAEIEEDFGGSYEERPAFYERHAIVNRALDIKDSGIKGAVFVHATDHLGVFYQQSTRRWLCPRNSSRSTLRAAQSVTDMNRTGPIP